MIAIDDDEEDNEECVDDQELETGHFEVNILVPYCLIFNDWANL